MEHADHEFISSVAESNQIFLRDGIATVSSDGQPHEILTLVAVFSGIFVAVFVLLALVMLIDRRQRNAQNNPKPLRQQQQLQQHHRRQSIFTIFCDSKSFDMCTTSSVKHQTCIFIDVADTFSKCRHHHQIDDAKFRTTNILPDITTISC